MVCVVFPVAARSLATVPETKVFLVLLLVMRGGELNVDGAEEHEHGRLQQADQKLEAVERNRNDDRHRVGYPLGQAEIFSQSDHGGEEILAGEDIAEQPE